jgi:hypothetical protein
LAEKVTGSMSYSEKREEGEGTSWVPMTRKP